MRVYSNTAPHAVVYTGVHLATMEISVIGNSTRPRDNYNFITVRACVQPSNVTGTGAIKFCGSATLFIAAFISCG